VIATDAVAKGRPNGGQQYVDEIKKVTDKPIKFLMYSHHHHGHVASGKAKIRHLSDLMFGLAIPRKPQRALWLQTTPRQGSAFNLALPSVCIRIPDGPAARLLLKTALRGTSRSLRPADQDKRRPRCYRGELST
jgi:hypothetical protein